jgi:hypothetical protein
MQVYSLIACLLEIYSQSNYINRNKLMNMFKKRDLAVALAMAMALPQVGLSQEAAVVPDPATTSSGASTGAGTGSAAGAGTGASAGAGAAAAAGRPSVAVLGPSTKHGGFGPRGEK